MADTDFPEISGAGGGKGGSGSQRAPREAPNTLQSRAIARVVDLISEGPIVGLVDGHKSIFYDKTPLQSADGLYNFEGASIYERTGLPNQDAIPGFPSGENTIAVSASVLQASPIVRRISDPDVDAVRVAVAVQSLNELDSATGDLNGSSVVLKIEVKAAANSGSSVYVQRVLDIISGKTVSSYERDYRIELDGEAPWDVRVTRLSADAASATVQNALSWTSYTEIVDSRINYADSAVIGQAINSEQFGSSVPDRTFLVKGRIISVPSNYNPTTRAYTGEWDGTFSQAWTNNPAWILYDLLTHERYGLGDLIATADIDKWEFYQAAQYCDQLVPDGNGGTEPRYTFNAQIRDQADAVQVIQSIAGMFKSVLVWDGAQFSVMQNRPKDPVKVFTPANVIDGAFNYTGTGLKARHTVAEVTWTNPARDWEPDVMAVEVPSAIERYGYNPIKFTAYGCTSPGQAYRTGLDVLLTESLEIDTVNFTCGLAEADLKLGDVFEVYDPMYTTHSRGGRIVSYETAGTDSVTLDREVPMLAARTYTLSIILSDGSLGTFNVVNPGTGNFSTLEISTPISAGNPPLPGAAWGLADNVLEPRYFICMRIAENDDDTYEVVGFQYDAQKFSLIDNGVFLPDLTMTYSDLGNGGSVLPPSDLVLRYTTRFLPNSISGEITASWTKSFDPYLRGYRVSYQYDKGSPITLPETKGLTVTISQRRGARLYVWVQAVSYSGKLSTPELKAMDMLGGSVAGRSVISNARIAGTSGLTFTGQDIHVIWTAVSPLTGGIASPGAPDPYFARYIVQVCNPAGGAELFTRSVQTPEIIIPYERLKATVVRRDYTLNITAVDIFGASSNVYTCTVSNPAQVLPDGYTLPGLLKVAGPGGLRRIDFPPPSDPDFVGYRVYYHSLSLFAVSEAGHAPYLVYEGPGPAIFNVQTGKTLQAFTVVAGDAFGYDWAGRVNWETTVSSAEGAVVPGAHTHAATDIVSGTINPARLGSGGGGSTKFLREDSTWQTVSTGFDTAANYTLSGVWSFGGGTAQSDASVRTRKNGNNFEWGHTNTSGYHGTLGSFVGSGDPFVMLNGEAGTNSNTFRTRGRFGAGIYVNGSDGRMHFGHVLAHTADNQTFQENLTLDIKGNMGLGATSPADFGTTWRCLSIGGNSKNGVIRLSSGTVVGDMFTDTTAFYIRTATSHSLVLRTADVDRFVIANNGLSQFNAGVGFGIAGNTTTALRAQTADTSSIATATGGLGIAEFLGNGGASMITFHRPGAFAGYFGIDTDNQLAVGGWSYGATRKVVLLEGGSYSLTALTLTSDERLKDEIEDYEGGLNEVLAMRPVTYVRKAPENKPPGWKSAGRELGLLAQAQQKIEPRLVSLNSENSEVEGCLALDYAKHVVPLINAVKTLHARIEYLERKRWWQFWRKA